MRNHRVFGVYPAGGQVLTVGGAVVGYDELARGGGMGHGWHDVQGYVRQARDAGKVSQLFCHDFGAANEAVQRHVVYYGGYLRRIVAEHDAALALDACG
jgi:hypothetical protein